VCVCELHTTPILRVLISGLFCYVHFLVTDTEHSINILLQFCEMHKATL